MKSLLTLAVALTVIPTVHAVATTPPPPPEGASAGTALPLRGTPAAAPPELVDRATRLAARARAHARRLGLTPGRASAPPRRTDLLERRVARMEAVVDFLGDRREARLALDERRTTAPAPRGRGLDARVARAHSLAVARALRLGLTHPGALRPAATAEARRAQLVRWGAVAQWLGERRERVRPGERPLRQRVPHYDALMCIASHEAGPEHGGWQADTGNGYYGGLQMDRSFQQTYAPALYRSKGTADNWTQEEQMRAAGRAVSTRGFTPWPNTARMCGLL